MTITEALACDCSRANTSSFGMARCTTAVSTPSIASIVRASSPSIARWKPMRWLNSEVVRPWLSKMPYPTFDCDGRSVVARSARTWYTSLAGTSTTVPPATSR